MDRDVDGYSLTDPTFYAHDYLPLSRRACQELGAPAQTLAAIYSVAGVRQRRSTFMRQERLAAIAMQSVRQFARNVEKLVAMKYVVNLGREPGVGLNGRPRRTCTFQLTPKTLLRFKPYLPMPRWIAFYAPESWSVRCLFAHFVGRHMLGDHITENNGSPLERRGESLRELCHFTGLARHSVIKARTLLVEERILVPAYEDFVRGDQEAMPLVLNADYEIPLDDVPTSVELLLQRWRDDAQAGPRCKSVGEACAKMSE